MKLIIDIPESIFNTIQADEMISREQLAILQIHILNGTPLPKGHGRLIDADSIYQIVRPIEPSDTEWGMTAETAIRLMHSAFNKAPTIIEADKESEGN